MDAPSPVFIGGTGGSGTRAVVRMCGALWVRPESASFVSAEPGSKVRLRDFVRGDGDPRRAAEVIRPPASLGRRRAETADEVGRVESAGRDGLRAFGYLVDVESLA